MPNVKNDYLFKFPLCNKKLWYSSVNLHRKVKNQDRIAKQFEILLIEFKSIRPAQSKCEYLNLSFISFARLAPTALF